MTLQTVNSKDLQRITIQPHDSPPETIEQEAYEEWQDLDRVLVQFWTSHSIRPQIVCMPGWGPGNSLRDNAPVLLPEMTRRGLVDFIEAPK